MTCPICLVNCLLSQHWQRERGEPWVFNSSRGHCSHCQVQTWFLVSEMDYIQETLSSWQVSWLVWVRLLPQSWESPCWSPRNKVDASFAEYSRLIVQFISLKRKIFSWLLIVEWVNWIVWLTWKVSELYSFGAVKSYLQPLNGLSAGLIKIPPFTIYQCFCVTNFPYIVA